MPSKTVRKCGGTSRVQFKMLVGTAQVITWVIYVPVQ